MNIFSGARARRWARWGAAMVALAILVVLMLAVTPGMKMGMFSGSRPDDLGTRDGRLAPCKASPNCVSSSARSDDAEHFIAPFTFTVAPERAWQVLRETMVSAERAAIARETEVYLHVEFSSRLMGFVDDAEFLMDASNSLIQVRSASRLGYSDLGVNRRRIETLRMAFNERLKR
jgi:uncharacterized protein (DUF1499 family)